MVERQYDIIKKERTKNVEEQKLKVEENDQHNGTSGGNVNGDGGDVNSVVLPASPDGQENGQPQPEVFKIYIHISILLMGEVVQIFIYGKTKHHNMMVK